MNKITVYASMINSDTMEGRGQDIVKAIFTTKSAAKEFCDRHEPYGFSGQYNRVQEYDLYDCTKEGVLQMIEETQKERALAKLTDKEKKLLGLIK